MSPDWHDRWKRQPEKSRTSEIVEAARPKTVDDVLAYLRAVAGRCLPQYSETTGIYCNGYKLSDSVTRALIAQGLIVAGPLPESMRWMRFATAYYLKESV